MQHKTILMILFGILTCFTNTILANDIDGPPAVFHKKGSTEIHLTPPVMETEFIFTAEDTEGRYSLVDEIFNPGMDSYPGHTHDYHSEMFYVISGKLQWTVSGETQVLEAGDAVYIPPGALHATKVIGDEPVHTLMLYQPGGYEIGFMARRALPPEQRRDPAVIAEKLHFIDIHFPVEKE
jgi:quercetin dioxygenase-like cupin family protein